MFTLLRCSILLISISVFVNLDILDAFPITQPCSPWSRFNAQRKATSQSFFNTPYRLHLDQKLRYCPFFDGKQFRHCKSKLTILNNQNVATFNTTEQTLKKSILRLSDPCPPMIALKGIIQMMRPGNIPGEIGLSIFGSLVLAQSASCLLNPFVLIVALSSALIGSSSMIINDYFDFRAGVDDAKPKPLVLGIVHPEQALLTAVALYMSALLACAVLLEPLQLRALVACAAATTFLYTPFLKGIPFVKNVAVAFVISQAITAGGLAVGSDSMVGLGRVILPTTYVFLTNVWREIFMDICDRDGDASAGVQTLPVLLGSGQALMVAAAFAVAAAATPFLPLFWTLAVRGSVFNLAAAILLIVLQMPAAWASIRAWRAGFDRPAVKQIVDTSLGCSNVPTVLALLTFAFLT